ncbi:cell wall-binding repeat-containing protein [Salinibacterium sp. SWN139]|uniref:cell wall-binding repeat-containing protein n=1 Tax=Salinibacterium sp. SWN139 TaxID=2792055 RepID=UPI0018CF09AA|nr:cell wall-binding repeat-containing protein [Salinibacterium sp. SWN139]MBH0052666.1 cell wall-binding repeat-containing protein [Salinibacterium sp. SWN139]
MLLTHKRPPAQNRPALTRASAKKLLAVASTALLAIGVSVTGALPATAAAVPTTEACAAVTNGPIATNQTSQGWTFTDTRAQGHNDFTAAGLHVWTEGATSADKAAAYKSVDLALKDAGVPVVNFVSNSGGVPSLQLITDFDNDGTADGILVGEPSFYGSDFWVPNSAAAFVKDNAPDTSGGHGSAYHGTLDEWLVEFPDARVLQIGYSLGSGVLGDAVIESIEVGCVSYGFSVDNAYSASTTVAVDDSEIAPFEDSDPASASYNYETWHEGYNSNTVRAYSTEADGLHLGDGTPSQVMLGTPGPVTATELEALITSASINVLEGKVTFQIPITYGTAANFTTVRSTSLVSSNEHHFDVTDKWVTSRPLKLANGSTFTPENAFTIADLVAFLGTQGNITLLGFGVQADSSAVVQDLVFDDTNYSFVPTAAEATTDHVVVAYDEIALNETPANYTTWHEGYANATKSFSVAADVLSFGSPSHSQILKGLETPVDGSDLYAQLTRHAAVTVDSGLITYQVAFTHDGAIGWGTIRSASLDAGEHTFNLSDPWKSSKNIGTAIVANTEYALGDILDALNAQGNALGTAFGIQADHAAQVSSLTWGTTEYSFSLKVIAAAPAISGTAMVGETLTAQPKASVWMPSTGVTFTYQWKANGTAISGATGSTYNVAAAELGKKITVTVTGSLAGYTSASETSPTTSSVVNDRIVVSRLSGADRYATAAEIAQEWDSASVVYIATGAGFADALSASSAAAYKDAPLLLTDPKSLSAAAKAELLRLKPSKIIIVGGSGAVSNSVKASLQSLSFNPSVTRIGGADRYATSRLLAQATFPASTVTTAYVANGSDFPDALTATPAAANLGGPVVLIPGNASKVDAATVTLLKSLGVTSVKIAGGSGVVSSAILTNLKTNFSTVKRNSGSDRYATAVAINANEFSSASTVYLATGSGFADALAGAALAGSQKAPLFITPSNCVPQSVLTAITNLDNPKVVLLGGTGVLTSSVASLTVCS